MLAGFEGPNFLGGAQATPYAPRLAPRWPPEPWPRHRPWLHCSGLIWLWLKINQEGLRRFWSMFSLTRVPFGYRFFEPYPFLENKTGRDLIWDLFGLFCFGILPSGQKKDVWPSKQNGVGGVWVSFWRPFQEHKKTDPGEKKKQRHTQLCFSHVDSSMQTSMPPFTQNSCSIATQTASQNS